MNRNYQNYLSGLEKPFYTISKKDAMYDACMAIGAFVEDPPSWVRLSLFFRAGQNVATIGPGELADELKRLYKKCSELEGSERLTLSQSEKDFIRAGIKGEFFKPFYE